eukprot:Gb_06167 [translate_table: standard]
MSWHSCWCLLLRFGEGKSFRLASLFGICQTFREHFGKHPIDAYQRHIVALSYSLESQPTILALDSENSGTDSGKNFEDLVVNGNSEHLAQYLLYQATHLREAAYRSVGQTVTEEN